MLRRRAFAGLATSSSSVGLTAKAQQSFATRSVRIVIPFAAGGPTDIVARLFADRLAVKLGQPVVVDARPGAGGAIAAEAVARAAPDGHTLLIGTATTHAVNPALQGGRLPFHPLRDFAPIAQIARVPIVLAVKPDLGPTNVDQMLALLRAKPGLLNYGSSGTGSMGHLATAMLLQQTRTEANHIPYRGSAPMAADLMSGRLDFASDALASLVPLVRDGRIRALAIATPDRASALPEVPTFAEAGLAEYEAYTWNVVFAPVGTPAAILREINIALNAIVEDPEITARLEEIGQPAVRGTTVAGTAAFVASELAKWEGVVRASGATNG